MARTLALAFLAAASILILTTFFGPVGGGVGAWVFALLAAAFPVALMALGAWRRGALGPVRWVLAALAAVQVGSVAGMMALRGRVADGPWLLGLPASAVLLFALMALPLLLTGLGFALTFDRWGPSAADLDVLRRRAGGAALVDGDG